MALWATFAGGRRSLRRPFGPAVSGLAAVFAADADEARDAAPAAARPEVFVCAPPRAVPAAASRSARRAIAEALAAAATDG